MKPEEGRGWGFSILLASFVFALLAFFPVGLDGWVHLALGRVADTFGSVPDRNIFVYPLEASESVGILSWLGQWWMFKIHEALSWHGLIFVRGLLVGFAVLVALLSTRALRVWLLLGLVFFPAFLGSIWMTPGIFGGTIWVVVSAIVISVLAGRSSRYWLLVLPLLSLPLVHIDSVFTLICLMTFWVAWKMRTRFAWGVALSTLAATLINPRGAEVWMLASKSFSIDWFVAAFLMIFAGALLARHVLSQRIHEERLPLVVAAALFGLFRPDLAFFAFLVMGMLSFSPDESSDTVPSVRTPWWVATLALIGAVLLQPLWAWWAPLASSVRKGVWKEGEQALVSQSVPLDSVRIIKSWGSRARVFNSPETAGLLMFELGEEPYPMLFTGPRELPELRNQALYELTISDPAVRNGIFHQYEIRAALLRKKDDAPIVESLLEDRRWRLIHEEGDYVLFGR